MDHPVVEQIMATGYPAGYQDQEVVAGTCENCKEALYEGEEDILEMDGDLFCETDCLIDYLEVKKVEL